MPHSNLFKRVIPLLLVISLVAISIGPSASAQSTLSTVIPYQGQLTDGGSPANSQYDFEFKLFDAASAGNQIGATSTMDNVQVTNGLFAVELDFGGSAFNGAARFLAIGVRADTSTGAFTALTPRRPLLAVPYALYSPSGSKPAYGMAANAPTNAAYVAANGNVGIGTTDPQSALHISTTASSYGALRIFNPTTNGEASLAFSDADGPIWGVGMGGYTIPNNFYIGSESGPKLMIKDNGNVGIGTQEPTDKLHVAGHMRVGGSMLVEGEGGQNLIIGGSPGVNEIRIGSTNPNVRWIRFLNSALDNHMGLVTSHLVIHNKGVANDQAPIWFEDGLGTHWEAGINLPNSPAGSFAIGVAAGARMFVEQDGKVTAEFLKLYKTAEVGTLKITGGADLAEPFAITGHDELQPGMVVTIDPDHPGQLRVAKSAYDHTVAGVVSGAGGVESGLIMQQEGSVASGSHPVALTGRVYVWADASNGPIQPGDLLTTASTPGHAMKVTDHTKAQGAILGKAMGTLEKGKGLVLMLVSLQ